MTELVTNEFAWLDIQPGTHTGLEQRAQIMRDGAAAGKDRIWWCDGEYVFFRRKKSNPATLERHNRFVAGGDYKHVETQGDVEIYAIQEQSQFSIKRTSHEIDLGTMDSYNVRRQAVLAACRRDFVLFNDICVYLRERVGAKHRSPGRTDMTPLGENIYSEWYMGMMASIKMRLGPSPQEINRELMNIAKKAGATKSRIISVGKG